MKFSGWTWCGSQPPLSLLHWAGAQKPPVLQRRSIEIEPVSVDHWPSLRSLFMPRPSLALPPPRFPTSSWNLGWPGIMRDLYMSEEITPPPPTSDWQAERKWPVADAHWLCHITALCRVPTGCSIMRYASPCCSATTASPHELCISVFTAALSIPSSFGLSLCYILPTNAPPHSPFCWF